MLIETQRREEGEAPDRRLKSHKPKQSKLPPEVARGREAWGGHRGGEAGIRAVKVASEVSGQLCRRKRACENSGGGEGQWLSSGLDLVQGYSLPEKGKTVMNP